MGRQDQIIAERLKKIQELRKNGINPYPYSFEKTHNSAEIKEKFEGLEKGEKTKTNVKVAGRLMNSRDFGKIAFGVLEDEQGKIQVVFQEKETPEKTSEFFKKYIDSGDFIGVEGIVARTERGEISVVVKNVEILSKATAPLPEKWHGLQDKEERYRKRYVDLVMNQDVKKFS